MSWKVPEERIKQIEAEAIEKVWSPFPTLTVVSWQLPNGYCISAQSGCVDPNDFDMDIGIDICRKHLRDKVWELEGYLQKQQYYREVTDKDMYNEEDTDAEN